MTVGGAKYSLCEYFFTSDLRASPLAWIFCTTPSYLFVPSRIRTVKPLSACLYKTLTLMLYNLINHPNLMRARRSCGQYVGLHLPPSLSSIVLMSYCHCPLPYTITANLVALLQVFVFLAASFVFVLHFLCLS